MSSPPVVDDLAQTVNFLGGSPTFDLFDVAKISAGQALFELQQSMQNKYVMRAYNTVLTQTVFWVSLGNPDFTGSQSAYPPVDLSDTILESVICPGQ